MKILIIEDDKRISSYLKKGLEAVGFNVVECNNGPEGLEIAIDEKFDLLLLDIMLPDIGGLYIIEKIREEGKHLPIIVLTSKDSLEDKVSGLNTGADDYLPKPFNFDELVARINAITRRTAATGNSMQLSCGNLVLNMISHNVYKNGVEIILTSREYALLEYFMKNINKILSRKNIIDVVWKNKYDTESNIIDVYIKRLRDKLEHKNEVPNPYIQSVRGVGYRMRVRQEKEEDTNGSKDSQD